MEKYVYKNQLLGSEIKERNPGMSHLDDNDLYEYSEGTKMYGDKIECHVIRIDTEDEKNESIAKANKKEAYEEYLELKEMKGADSAEALAAKDAYNLIDVGGVCKSRYDLETELSNVSTLVEEAIDFYTLELIEGGIL